MERFLIISPHTLEDCNQVIGEVYAMGYLTHFEWGCGDGEHCGWAIIEAESAKQALLVVPVSHRPKARAIRLTRFSAEQAQAMHRGH